MKLLTFSDTHIGRPAWEGFGEKVFAKVCELCLKRKPDVVLFCGDLVEEGKGSTKHLADGLRLFQEVPAKKKLWVAGNNDLEPLYGKFPLQSLLYILQEQADKHGIHVLDYSPYVIDNIAFVGSFGGWDLSLWRTPVEKSPHWPDTYADLKKGMDQWHRTNVGVSVQEMFDFFQTRLKGHLQSVEGHKIVLATHTVPTKDLLIYGGSPYLDFKNSTRGWEDAERFHIKHNVVLQLCGHTHRKGQLVRPGHSSLWNVSGEDQPFLFDV